MNNAEEHIKKVKNIAENPFLLALIIVVLNTIIIFWFSNFGNTDIKGFIRTFIYMYIINLGIIYLHHYFVSQNYESKLSEKMGVANFMKSGPQDLAVKLEDNKLNPNDF